MTEDQIRWQDTQLICNQDQGCISLKNKVGYTVDTKIQKEFLVKVLMVTLTLLLLPASSARAQTFHFLLPHPPHLCICVCL